MLRRYPPPLFHGRSSQRSQRPCGLARATGSLSRAMTKASSSEALGGSRASISGRTPRPSNETHTLGREETSSTNLGRSSGRRNGITAEWKSTRVASAGAALGRWRDRVEDVPRQAPVADPPPRRGGPLVAVPRDRCDLPTREPSATPPCRGR